MDLTKLITETKDALKSININTFNYEIIRDNIFITSDKLNYKIILDRNKDGNTNAVIFGDETSQVQGNLDKVIKDIKNIIM